MTILGALVTHPISYHQQDTATFCGGASAQMVLRSIGTGFIDQQTLITSNQNHTSDTINPPWSSPPDGIVFTLENLKPNGFTKTFAITEHMTADSLSRNICWSIHHHDVAPIVLVRGEAHWIIVTRFLASKAPAAPDDPSYTIDGFFIHNPEPPLPTNGNEPPHLDGDGCGSGSDRGTPHEFVAYEPKQGVAGSNYWRIEFLYRPVAIDDSDWDGAYLAVCPGADAAANTQDPPPQSEGDLMPDSEETTAEIIARARQGLDDYGLSQLEPWSVWLQEGQNLSHELFLVEREGSDPERFYYIVALRRANGDIPILANVSAHQDGGFAGSIAAPVDATTHFTTALRRDEILERFVGQDTPVGDIVVVPEEDDLLEHLVWRPCRESLSQYWPFYRFDTEGPEGPVRFYVRIDGVLFPDLHEGRGM